MIGLNILGDRGVSEQEIVNAASMMRASYYVVMNNPSLAAKIQSLGFTTVIYREQNDDDNAQDRTDPVEFVRRRHQLAPQGAAIYLGNEPYPTVKLATWTLAAMQECDRLNRRGVILNFSTGNPSRNVWSTFDAVIAYAFAHGHILGLHEYFDVNWRKDYTYHVGRFLDVFSAFGRSVPKIVITELGCCVGFEPHRGYKWNGSMTDAAYGGALNEIANMVYTPYNVDACIFAYGSSSDDWGTFKPEPKVVEIVSANNVQSNPISQPIDGIVSYTAASITNIRSQPATSSAIIGQLVRDQRVKFYEQTVAGESGQWWKLSPNGYAANVYKQSVICKIVRDETDRPIKILDVPYVSQRGGTASKRNNDCLIASCLMLYQDRLVDSGFGVNQVLSVDASLWITPLAGTDAPLGIADGLNFLSNLGVEPQYIRPIDLPKIRQLIDSGKPVVALVRYKYIKEDEFTGGHFLVIIGYGTKGFYVNDPYAGGEKFYVSNENMDLALTDLDAYAALDYQGIIIQ